MKSALFNFVHLKIYTEHYYERITQNLIVNSEVLIFY